MAMTHNTGPLFFFFFPAVDWIELSRGEFGVCMFLVAVSK